MKWPNSYRKYCRDTSENANRDTICQWPRVWVQLGAEVLDNIMNMCNVAHHSQEAKQ